jgi:anti-sigma regulatory factor (Ser/Thr protein kinase)
MLIEVTRLANGKALPELLDRVVWVLRNRLKYRKNDSFDIATVISELCQNTFDHNSDACGFVAMQVYGRGSNRFLEIAVSDHGLGLADSLRRNPKNGPIDSDQAAIRLATEIGVSEHDDPTRGT